VARVRKKKAGSSRSKREMRIKAQRLKKIYSLLAVFVIISGVIFAGDYYGIFKKAKDWTKTETIALTIKSGFKVKNILVSGRKHVSIDKVLSYLSIKKKMPIFTVDINEAKRSLFNISWVKSVYISRRLPDTIFVKLNERVPVALWQKNNRLYLIDNDGVILTQNNLNKWKYLPLIVGKNSRKKVAELTALLGNEPSIAQRIISAQRVASRRWNFRLKNGILIKLPEKDIEFALRRLVDIEEKKNILEKNIKAVDLREPEKMIVSLVNEGSNVSLKNRGRKKGAGA